MSWTREMDARLIELIGGGASHAEAARAIGGVSRNACIGRFNRLTGTGATNAVQPAAQGELSAAAQAARAQAAAKRAELAPLREQARAAAVAQRADQARRRAEERRQAVALAPRPKRVFVADEPPALGEPETLGDRGTCRWIHGEVDQPGWRMCGHKAPAGSSWCDHHAARVTTPARGSRSGFVAALGERLHAARRWA